MERPVQPQQPQNDRREMGIPLESQQQQDDGREMGIPLQPQQENDKEKKLGLPFLRYLPALFKAQMQSPEFPGNPFLSAQIEEFPGLVIRQVVGNKTILRAYQYNRDYTSRGEIKFSIYDGPTPQISITCISQLEKVITEFKCEIFNTPEPVIKDNRPVEILVPAATVRYSFPNRKEQALLDDPGVLTLFDVVRDFFGVDIKSMRQDKIIDYFKGIYEDICKKKLD